MREIKFRTFVDNEMVYLPMAGLQYFDFEGSYALSFVVDGYTGFWAHEQYDSVTKKVSKSPIMQYTGLKDKNGKEIYEGDVIEGSELKGSIEFGEFDGMIGWFVRLTVGIDYPIGSCVNIGENINIEVVGNIYEHPHLIIK